MLKKIISILISVSLACALGIPAIAVNTDEEEIAEPQVLMDGTILNPSEADSNTYSYIVDSLEDIPVLSCRFDRENFTCLITQPTRENGYKGKVTLTSEEAGSITDYTVNVYDNNTFDSHFINLGGDPWVTYHDGWYYYMVTGNAFYVSKSRELERVNSNPVSVFNMADLVDNETISIVKELWAPELHFIDGYWYIYFTIYDGEAVDSDAWNGCTGTPSNHRMYVLKSDTSDAQGSYTFMGQLKEKESDYINDDGWKNAEYNIKPGHWAIDQSIFRWNEKLYAVWSGWSGYKSVDQRIFVAEMSDPYTISSNRVELSRPEYAYETYSVIPAINEAPQALISPDGKTLNIAFSVNRFDDPTYSLGLLTLKEGGDPLNADDWTKTKEPVLETSIKNSTYSVGHCSFVPSPDGSDYYVVYHARRGEDVDSNPREIRAQQFYWYDDGTPCFDEPVNAADLVEIPSGTAIIDRTKIEAESATLSGKASIASSKDGTTTYQADYYSGGSHIILTTEDSAATFSYNAEKSGKYTLSLLASGSHSTASGFTVTVNGTEYTRRLGGNSSNINNFYYYDLNGIELCAGENTITVSHNGVFSRGGYLDRLDIWNEADDEIKWTEQDENNNNTTKTAVIKTKAYKSVKQPEYNKEYTFNNFGDFDKYWFTSEPFVDDPVFENVITTCRAGGNKRLLVTGEEFNNISDFKTSVEIIPTAEHIRSDGVTVTDETAINAGILFRIGKMTDYTSNVCTFDGYRCFLTVSDGVVKMQLSRYYFASDTETKSTNKVLKTAADTLAYTPGDKYVIELSCIGNTVNAKAYNTNSPETVITIENQSIVTSVADTLDSGRIGLFVNCVSRVAFANLKVTPYYSSAGLTCDFGKLNELDAYDMILPASRSFTESQGKISIPTGVSKLLIKDEKAQNISNFSASSRIKITQTNACIQAGIAFRVKDAVSVSPGLTGYVVYIQRTTSANFTGSKLTNLNISLTKYGTTASGTANKNLGTSPRSTTALLSDKTAIADIVGTEFYLDVTVLNNILTATISRADNPEMTATFSWVLDSEKENINVEQTDAYYESGKLGFFSNGYAEISEVAFNPLFDEYEINTEGHGGSIVTDTAQTEVGTNITATLLADNGYYIDPKNITATLADGKSITLNFKKSYWDTSAVYNFKLPKGTVNINCEFKKILSGDANSDESADIRDLIRTKKYLSRNTDKIALSNIDSNTDKTINATDLSALRKQLLYK